MKFGFREFGRLREGIIIWIGWSDWPKDIPIITGSKFIGENECFRPYVAYTLSSTKTFEVVWGKFSIDKPYEKVVAWHKQKMKSQNWKKVSEKTYINDKYVKSHSSITKYITFEFVSADDVQVRIIISRCTGIEKDCPTFVTVLRILKVPYKYPKIVCQYPKKGNKKNKNNKLKTRASP
jgi:hypothetical protein